MKRLEGQIVIITGGTGLVGTAIKNYINLCLKLNKEFPTWKGDNDEENKKVLDYLEDQNYYLTITNLERLME